MPKDDHFVAQTYLRGFTDEEGLLFPYYKNGRVVIGKRKSPKQVCYETDGDSNTYFDNPRILDEYLPRIENPWTSNIAKLTAGDVDADCRYEMGAYIAFLRSCTPTAKRLGANAMSADLQPLVDKTLAEHLHELGEITYETRSAIEKAIQERGIHAVVDEEYVHAVSIQNLIQAAHRFYCSHWLVLVNETDIPFITSDNPASLYHTEQNSLFAIVFVPLSPSIAVMIKPDFEIDRPTIDDVESYKHRGDDYANPKKDFVKHLNELIVKSAENLVLHSDKEEWVEALVSNHKNWRIESKTFELPYDREMIIIHRQMACEKA